MYNILSVQTYNMCNIFLPADCFNDIVFILLAKISSKKVCEKQLNVEQGFASVEQERRAVALSRSNF